jgi:hypothetical protein
VLKGNEKRSPKLFIFFSKVLFLSLAVPQNLLANILDVEEPEKGSGCFDFYLDRKLLALPIMFEVLS